jgi:hypothetical protein
MIVKSEINVVNIGLFILHIFLLCMQYILSLFYLLSFINIV